MKEQDHGDQRNSIELPPEIETIANAFIDGCLGVADALERVRALPAEAREQIHERISERFKASSKHATREGRALAVALEILNTDI